jgi:hypothetical protein
MRTVVLGPPPPELTALIARRHQLGLDKFDEVWEGDYHMAPMAHSSQGWIQDELSRALHQLGRPRDLIGSGPVNIGSPDDFRVPDWVLYRGSRPNSTWVPTATIVVEIESPDDESWEKLPFYASRGVEEVLIVSPPTRSMTWLILEDGRYVESQESRLLGPESARLIDMIEWPPPSEEHPAPAS